MRKLSDAQRDEIVDLYTTPAPDGTWRGCYQIAVRYDVSAPTVRHTLLRRGVQMRGVREMMANGKACKPTKRVPRTLAPNCACGCGDITAWNQRKDRWNRYVAGHYSQRGTQNHEWAGGVQNFPYCADWLEVSRRIRWRDGYVCQLCSAKIARKRSMDLHVHHIDRDKGNNEPCNLVSLCRRCHGWVHSPRNAASVFREW